MLLAGPGFAGERLGALPPHPISRSFTGPSDELIGYLAFDPAVLASKLPQGLRFVTLSEKAGQWPGLARYLLRHPERGNWAWSVYEIIGIQAARYDRVAGHFDGGTGGMAVWYVEVTRSYTSDERPLGTQQLAAGSWVSDSKLAAYMRKRGFPAADGRVTFRRSQAAVSGALQTDDLTITGNCQLQGKPFIPEWGKTATSHETMWTPLGEGDTFEVVTWAGHRSRTCVNASWQVRGEHPFAQVFNDPQKGDPQILGTEFAFGYLLRSGLYNR